YQSVLLAVGNFVCFYNYNSSTIYTLVVRLYSRQEETPKDDLDLVSCGRTRKDRH
ncbi:unnamed protein product, partial [Brassica rapa subsp. trilocularis]